MSDKINKIFKPSEKQIELLRAMLDVDTKPTITAFCEKAGISRDTYYRWFDDKSFVRWFNEEWENEMGKMASWLDRVGLTRSVKDFRYWEAMQMKYGKYKRKQEVELTDNEELAKKTESVLNEIRRLAKTTGGNKEGN